MSFIKSCGVLILIGDAIADGVVDCDLARRGRHRLSLAYARSQPPVEGTQGRVAFVNRHGNQTKQIGCTTGGPSSPRR